MDPTGIDPQILELGARLGEVAVRSTAASILSQMKAVKAKRDKDATISEYEEIIRGLIADRSEALQIAQAYQQELVAQRISDEDIKYINDTLVPLLEKFIDEAGATGDPAAAESMKAGLKALKPLLSAETFKVLQLVGFNFKRAIGEPLTFLVQRLITARVATDPQTVAETNRLNMAGSVELLKIAQDEEATARLNQVMSTWRGNG